MNVLIFFMQPIALINRFDMQQLYGKSDCEDWKTVDQKSDQIVCRPDL